MWDLATLERLNAAEASRQLTNRQRIFQEELAKRDMRWKFAKQKVLETPIEFSVSKSLVDLLTEPN